MERTHAHTHTRVRAHARVLVVSTTPVPVPPQAAAGSPIVCLDIPLLFEKGLQEGMDAILVVSTTPEQQEQRVLSRPGMSREKFEAIKSRQVRQ